ncbi:MAG: hypothetical protein KatS3mg008_1529 [Acidimicrobiales bacterium]|nr:MAG: hypothetical protein KatS3mg008_1529 [Acidimicrobiales bacterium]
MLICCWSPKGGTGTTVVAAGVACLRSESKPTLLVDLGGDMSLLFQSETSPPAVGLDDWLACAEPPPPDALARLEHPVSGGVISLLTTVASRQRVRDTDAPRSPDRRRDRSVVPGADSPAARVSGRHLESRTAELVDILASESRDVVVDAGPAARAGDSALSQLWSALQPRADLVLLVVRPCVIALRRALDSAVESTGVVVVRDEGRSLDSRDVAEVLGLPVLAEIPVDPSIAVAVDAGLFSSRPPRKLLRALRSLS